MGRIGIIIPLDIMEPAKFRQITRRLRAIDYHEKYLDKTGTTRGINIEVNNAKTRPTD